jgi:hypothetical protein
VPSKFEVRIRILDIPSSVNPWHVVGAVEDDALGVFGWNGWPRVGRMNPRIQVATEDGRTATATNVVDLRRAFHDNGFSNPVHFHLGYALRERERKSCGVDLIMATGFIPEGPRPTGRDFHFSIIGGDRTAVETFRDRLVAELQSGLRQKIRGVRLSVDPTRVTSRLEPPARPFRAVRVLPRFLMNQWVVGFGTLVLGGIILALLLKLLGLPGIP